MLERDRAVVATAEQSDGRPTGVTGQLARLRELAIRRRRFGGSYEFDDRRGDSDKLIVVLAGFKEYLWRYTLGRLERFAPRDADICLVSAGMRSTELSELAARRGWSYLSTRTSRVGTAQNIAIREHPAAEWIYKVDEDVLVTESAFENVLAGYCNVQDEGIYRPGFAAPILNVNGFSYVAFLEKLQLSDSYRREFGGLPRACTGIPIHADGQAAAWIWRQTIPLDETAARFSDEPFSYSTVPHRFSTGFILFRRDLWDAMGGFRAGLQPPGLGVDETHLCQACVELSRVMVVVHNSCVGHFSFGPQEETMRELLGELGPGLELRE